MTADADAAAEWHIITSEYPPEVGGVADYSAQLSSHLAEDRPTHVWCPGVDLTPTSPARAAIHRVLGSFSRADLHAAGAQLDRLPSPRRLLVQWVPHGFGFRSLNLGMALWCLGRARRHGDDLQVVIHEPCSPLSLYPTRLVAALMHRLMLAVVCAGASKVWISTPSWGVVVRPFLFRRVEPEWLPIPAPDIGPVEREEIRAATDVPVVGHFGTYSSLIAPLLEPALDIVLERTKARVLLIGRDSDRFAGEYLGRHPRHAHRVSATGVLPLGQVGRHVATCDVMLQPYPDGLSARRTTALALLKAGLPVVTNSGHLCESFWAQEQAVELVPAPDAAQLGEAAVHLLENSERRLHLSARARAMYVRYFDVSHGVAALTRGARHRPWERATP